MLSLVVPVYNVAPYLAQCLDSIADPAGVVTEVILVDDGSTDEGPAILARYAEKYPHFRVIRQENGGLSVARNTGLNEAHGKYIAFVDSDDYITPGYYANLVQLAEFFNVPMAVGNGVYHFEGRKEDFPIFRDNLPRGPISSRELLKRRLKDKSFLHMVWMHVYRKDFIDRHAMRFVPRLIHEDVPWTTRAFLLAGQIAYDPLPGYFYRQRVRRYEPADLDMRLTAVIDSSIFNARELANMAQEISDDPELQILLRWQLVDGALSIFHKLRKFSSARIRQAYYRRLRKEGVFFLLWKNAVAHFQRRKIARNYFKSWLPN